MEVEILRGEGKGIGRVTTEERADELAKKGYVEKRNGKFFFK
ncbi:MAG: hypothetical protein NTU58_04185 [Candidatus Nealsonbacteria bacterium]|nr:hypothetical protein [Candidatus Nealsonbacteria bacterium]